MAKISKIKLTKVEVDDPNHVGQKGAWRHLAKVNNVRIKIMEEKKIDITNDEIEFHLEAYEMDKIEDKEILDKTIVYKDIKGESIKIDVIVIENRGQYAKNQATVTFSFDIS